MLGILVSGPEVVCGRDHDEPHEGGEEVEEGVPAVIVLELLPRHGTPRLRLPRLTAATTAPRWDPAPSSPALCGAAHTPDAAGAPPAPTLHSRRSRRDPHGRHQLSREEAVPAH